MRVFTENKMNTVRAVTNLMIQINEYSLLLIISFPPAKENFSRAVTPRHITTGILCAIKMTKESLIYCFYASTNAKILNYKTTNFLVRKKSKVVIFILLLQRFKEELSH